MKPSASLLMLFMDAFCEKLEILLPQSLSQGNNHHFKPSYEQNYCLENSYWLPTIYKIIHLSCKMQPIVSIGTTHKQPFTFLLHTIMAVKNCAIYAIYNIWMQSSWHNCCPPVSEILHWVLDEDCCLTSMKNIYLLLWWCCIIIQKSKEFY